MTSQLHVPNSMASRPSQEEQNINLRNHCLQLSLGSMADQAKTTTNDEIIERAKVFYVYVREGK